MERKREQVILGGTLGILYAQCNIEILLAEICVLWRLLCTFLKRIRNIGWASNNTTTVWKGAGGDTQKLIADPRLKNTLYVKEFIIKDIQF